MTSALQSPVKRAVTSAKDGPMVVEVFDQYLLLRPKRAKRGGPAEVTLPWGALYLRGMMAKAAERQRGKRKKRVRRGALA